MIHSAPDINCFGEEYFYRAFPIWTFYTSRDAKILSGHAIRRPYKSHPPPSEEKRELLTESMARSVSTFLDLYDLHAQNDESHNGEFQFLTDNGR